MNPAARSAWGEMRRLQRAASRPRYVIVILESVFGTDLNDYVDAAVDSDWDPLLNAALAELGLRSSDQQPKWMSYQSGSDN